MKALARGTSPTYLYMLVVVELLRNAAARLREASTIDFLGSYGSGR
jgi:hypothetical protein